MFIWELGAAQVSILFQSLSVRANYCSVYGMFSLLLSGGQTSFHTGGTLGNLPDGQNFVEPICIITGFRAVIPKHWA